MQIKSGNSFPISEFEVNVNGNGKTSHKVTQQGRLSIRTACDPKQFKETVVALTSKRSRSLIERIIGMGEFNGSTVKVTKKCSDGTKKGSAGESDNVSTSLHSPISEDIKAMSEIYGVKSDVPRVSSLLDCLESKLCILRNKICEVEQLVVVMKVGVIECIVSNVIEAVKSMMADTIDHGALDSKEEIDAHDCGTVIGRETFPRQLTSLMHKPSDGRWKKPLDEDFEPKEVS